MKELIFPQEIMLARNVLAGIVPLFAKGYCVCNVLLQ